MDLAFVVMGSHDFMGCEAENQVFEFLLTNKIAQNPLNHLGNLIQISSLVSKGMGLSRVKRVENLLDASKRGNGLAAIVASQAPQKDRNTKSGIFRLKA